MNYLKHGLGNKEVDHMRQPMTKPKDQPAAARGALVSSLQSLHGLCGVTTKCVRKDGHANECWPK